MPEPGQADNPSKPNQPKARNLKSLSLKQLDQSQLFSVLEFLNFLQNYDYSKQETRVPRALIQNAPAEDFIPAFSTKSTQDTQPNNIHQVYQAESFQTHFLPADVIAVLRDTLYLYLQTYGEKLNQPQYKTENEQLSATFTELKNEFTNSWPNDQITKNQEVDLAREIFAKKQISDLIGGVITAISNAHLALGLPIPEQLEQAPSDQTSKTTSSLPRSSSQKTEKDEAEGGEEPEVKEELSKQSLPSPLIIDQNLELLSTSFTYATLSAVLAAYASDEAGNPLIDLSQLSDPLRNTLVAQIKPQVQNILANLTLSEAAALANNTAEASAVKAKILRQTHAFILRSPISRLLIQQAFTEKFAQLTPEQQQTLEGSLKANGHEQAKEQLAQIAQEQNFGLFKNLNTDGQELSAEQQKTALKQISALSTDYKTNFLQSLQQVANVDPEHPSVNPLNIDSTLSSLFISNPLLTPNFINSLSYEQFSGLFGQVTSKEVFQAHQRDLKSIFRQYWIFYRAELNRTNPQLNQLSEYQLKDLALSPEQTDDSVSQAVTLRNTLQAQASPANQQTIQALSNRDKSQKSATDQPPSNYVREFKLQFWQNLSIAEKQRYLAEVGFQEKAYQEKTEQELTNFLNERQQELDLFAYYLAEAKQAQQVALANTIGQAYQAEAQTGLQLQAILSGGNFFSPEQTMNFANGESAAFAPNSTSSVLSQAQQLGGNLNGGLKALTSSLAAQGVDAALIAATGGAYAALPEPLRKMFDKFLGDKVAKQAKMIIGLGLGALAGLAAALAAVVKQGGFVLGGGLTGALAGGIYGFTVGGPIGAVAGATAGFLTGSGLTYGGMKLFEKTAPFRANIAQSLQQGWQNFTGALKGLGRNILNKTGFGQAGVGGTSSLLQSLGSKLAAAKEGLVELLVHNTAAQTVIAYTGITAAGTIIALNAGGAFLVDISNTAPLGKAEAEGRFSPYVEITKTASLPSCPNNRCDALTSNEDIIYTIIIKPKNNYQLTIKSIADEFIIHLNDEKHTEIEIEQITAQFESSFPTQTADDFDDLEPNQVIEPGEELIIIYQTTFTPDYNHSNIRNVLKINFDYDNGADAGTEEALGSEVVCLGECPQGLGCWPTSGEITQLPYSRSHNDTHAKYNLDAFDIAAIISTPVYTPWTGTVCLQAYDDDGYGEYLKLETEIEGQKYYFIFAHLWEGHSVITTPGECVQVSESEVIGQVGDSGNSTGAHLHYELVNSGLVKYELSDLVPDGYNLTGNYDPAGSCFDF